MARNPFQVNDVVRCLASHYKSYSLGDVAVVRDVVSDSCIQLDNSLTDYGSSTYSILYWELVRRPTPKPKEPKMAYEKTKYFGMKIDGMAGTQLYFGGNMTTELRDFKSDALADIQAVIAEGEKWIVVKTEAMVEQAPPRPPVTITEYK